MLYKRIAALDGVGLGTPVALLRRFQIRCRTRLRARWTLDPVDGQCAGAAGLLSSPQRAQRIDGFVSDAGCSGSAAGGTTAE